ncbi:MAG: hypothetical protein QM723_38860 [Myxococcaceae bacterium]
MKAGDKTVYVLPEAQGNAGSSPTDWRNAKNIGDTTREALQNAKLPSTGATYDISVHSAGGRALATALNNGEKLSAYELSLQDATFDGAWNTINSKLKDQTGVQHVTLQGSDERESVLGNRHKSLLKTLNDAGISTDRAPNTKSHDAASRTFEAPAPHHRDSFDH